MRISRSAATRPRYRYWLARLRAMSRFASSEGNRLAKYMKMPRLTYPRPENGGDRSPPPNFYHSSSNRVGCKGFLRCRCREHGRLRGRHVPPHDGASRGDPSKVHHAFRCRGRRMQRMSRSWSAYVPAGRLAAPRDADELGCQAVARVSLNGSPVINMLCMMTASLRATATAARLNPSRSRSCSPHLRRSHSDRVRTSNTVAAS